ncbi:MAG: hypothetical protein IJL66_08530 [Lachnospiraceae bacterium]|nr:hypothetical protein [Lachnospiraceae bacterium]
MKSRKKQKSGRGALALLFAVLVLCAGAFLWYTFAPGSDRADPAAYYAAMGDAAVYVDSSQAAVKTVRQGEEYYLEESWVKESLVPRLFYEAEEDAWLYALPNGNAVFPLTGTAYTLPASDGGPASDSPTKGNLNAPAGLTKDGERYVSAEVVCLLTGAAAERFSDPSRLYLWTMTGAPKEQAVLKDDAVLRAGAGRKSLIVAEEEKGAKALLLSEAGDWTLVRTQDGHLGYTQARHLEGRTPWEPVRSYIVQDYSRPPRSGRVVLSWHAANGPVTNATLEDVVKEAKGLTAVSPTWFSLTGDQGEITSAAERSYVDRAHELGVEVWIRLDDFDKENDVAASLGTLSRRSRLIGQILAETLRVGADGINVDFERIRQESSEGFLQFVRELSAACRREDLVLSVDNFALAGNHHIYQPEEQAVFADYIVTMGYGEHWRGSGAGTNASIGFTRKCIEEMLGRGVPADQLVHAIPFYVPVWRERPAQIGDAGARTDGDPVYPIYTLDVSSVSMGRAAAMLADAGVTPTWLETEGCWYGQYEEDGAAVRIWLEDVRSVKLKCKEVEEAGIAGIAAWRLGFEDPGVWPLIGDGADKTP